jgi:flagella basal body P-ring formation protein FlgA
MNRNLMQFVLAGCLPLVVQPSWASQKLGGDHTLSQPAIRIHLPRKSIVKGASFDLGQVGILRGEQSLVIKASRIGLGRFSVPGQKVVIDKVVVLSRLASNGIGPHSVKLTGADQVTVRRRQKVIISQEFIEFAESFLKKRLPLSVGHLEPIRTPKDFSVTGAGDGIELSARLGRGASPNQAKVEITVLRHTEQIATRQVVFRLMYNSHKLVAVADIPQGAMLTSENITVEKSLADQPEPANFKPPYGAITKRPIAAGAVIAPRMIRTAPDQLMVKRNETVVIRVERPGLLVTAIGKVFQDGAPGDFIRVQNVDSKRTILAKVNDDGTVEPAY